MKQPGAVCKFGIIGDIFQKHGEWFSKHPALKKANIIDPGRILEMKFEQMFNRPLAEFDLMNLSKTDAKSFKDELKFIIKSFEGGQVNTKLGEYLWSTQERAKNAPQLANVYNDFLNINHRRKGYQIKSEEMYQRILDSLRLESTRLGYHEGTMIRGEKGGFKKSIKKGMDLEAKIYEAQVDVQNKVPGSSRKLQNSLL